MLPRRHSSLLLALLTVAFSTSVLAGPLAAADSVIEEANAHLEEARLDEAAALLEAHLEENEKDAQARFQLGAVQFLQAIEHLAQSHYRYGLLQEASGQIPLLRIPVPPNPKPKKLTYRKARQVLERFVDDLAVAEATLARVDTSADCKLPIHIGRIRFDIDGDGKGSDTETLWRMYRVVNAGIRQTDGEQFLIIFDAGDVRWLQGYCHLLSAMGDTVLAYNWKELFDRCAHLFYPRPVTSYPWLAEEKRGRSWDMRQITDLIAFIHLINFPVKEPERLESALHHLRAMIGLSRESWELIQAESDDDHEWLPNPRQTGVIPRVRVEQAMIDSWHEFLIEAEEILAGEKLVPYWRGPRTEGVKPKGVNIHKVFTEPRRFDLVMWVQGTDAVPYLEEGQLSDPTTWNRLQQVFRGQFIGFAIWFN
ncbi:hypothetical protein Mal4_34350 [Maioricimonas rarisocia]|uniref:Uncharacterized protein n=1 Tax=Maioricimonas rarisocia TaxID=2528026 RepID=A0A517Z9K2_9PLAN|nr:hypothetical protein [Maioricimonas rarisocia]QDU39100.1 hypothetical protein Mal4_34350 [Maioricimonas rarisocia]